MNIHTVFARPDLFPYNDVVKWCFIHLQKDIGLIVNASGVPIASLKMEDIKFQYKILEPIVAIVEMFLDKFRVDHNDFETLMEDWFIDEEWPLNKGERHVLTQYLKDPYRMLNAMICRLYGEETSTHFRMEWFSMAYIVAKTKK